MGRRKLLRLWIVSTVALGIAFACAPDREPPPAAPVEVAEESVPAGWVKVQAVDYAFVLPDTLPSGWTTFEFENLGKEPHFFLLGLLPEGKTLEDYRGEVATAFGEAWEALQAGGSKQEAGGILGEQLPEWFGSVRYMGGIGLVVPGETARTTVRLEPGNYTMECYVKTADGRFHVDLGMLRGLTVTAEDSGASEPAADIEITLTNDGIVVGGDPTEGPHTVAVHFEEHPEIGLGNDVHLVRLEEDTDLDALAAWMDWMNIDGLRSPAPATFLGGAEEMPVGSTAYFEVELTPGRYAWIGESPERRLVEFTVAGEGG